MDAIFKLGKVIQNILEARLARDEPRYREALKNIPQVFQNEWHILMGWIAQFIITYFDGRRGAEGIENLTRNMNF